MTTPRTLEYTHDSYAERMLYYICEVDNADEDETIFVFVPSPMVARKHLIGKSGSVVPMSISDTVLQYAIKNETRMIPAKYVPSNLMEEINTKRDRVHVSTKEDADKQVMTWYNRHYEQYKVHINTSIVGRPPSCEFHREGSSILDSVVSGIESVESQNVNSHVYKWRTKCICDVAHFRKNTLIAITSLDKPDNAFQAMKIVIECGMIPTLFIEHNTYDLFEKHLLPLKALGSYQVESYDGVRNIGMKRRHILQVARKMKCNYVMQIDDSVDLRKIYRMQTREDNTDESEIGGNKIDNITLQTTVDVIDLLLATEAISAALSDVVVVGCHSNYNFNSNCSFETTSITQQCPYKLCVIDLAKLDSRIKTNITYENTSIGEDILFYHDIRAHGLSVVKLTCGIRVKVGSAKSRKNTGVTEKMASAISRDQFQVFDRLMAFCNSNGMIVYGFPSQYNKIDLFRIGQSKYAKKYKEIYKHYISKHGRVKNVRYGILRKGDGYGESMQKLLKSNKNIKYIKALERHILDDYETEKTLDSSVDDVLCFGMPQYYEIPSGSTITLYEKEGGNDVPKSCRYIPAKLSDNMDIIHDLSSGQITSKISNYLDTALFVRKNPYIELKNRVRRHRVQHDNIMQLTAEQRVSMDREMKMTKTTREQLKDERDLSRYRTHNKHIQAISAMDVMGAFNYENTNCKKVEKRETIVRHALHHELGIMYCVSPSMKWKSREEMDKLLLSDYFKKSQPLMHPKRINIKNTDAVVWVHGEGEGDNDIELDINMKDQVSSFLKFDSILGYTRVKDPDRPSNYKYRYCVKFSYAHDEGKTITRWSGSTFINTLLPGILYSFIKKIKKSGQGYVLPYPDVFLVRNLEGKKRHLYNWIVPDKFNQGRKYNFFTYEKKVQELDKYFMYIHKLK
jgi:hypothetical protein